MTQKEKNISPDGLLQVPVGDSFNYLFKRFVLNIKFPIFSVTLNIGQKIYVHILHKYIFYIDLLSFICK